MSASASAAIELGLDPDGDVALGPRTYWGVADAEAALRALLERGAVLGEGLRDVGEGIRVATVRDPAGSVIGIIENPHSTIVAPAAAQGPGR